MGAGREGEGEFAESSDRRTLRDGVENMRVMYAYCGHGRNEGAMIIFRDLERTRGRAK